MKITILVSRLILAAALGLTWLSAPGAAYASPVVATPYSMNDSAGDVENAVELTYEQYLEHVAEFYARNPQFEIVIDLRDPDGIDPALLPEDVRDGLRENEVVTEYREFINLATLEIGRAPGHSKLCLGPVSAIGCAASSGGRDITTSSWWGGIKQFGRVIALRYDHYVGTGFCSYAQNCKGWEIETQYGWWERSSTAWTVTQAKFYTQFLPEATDYCTSADTSLNYSSNTFTPTWQTTYKTAVYLISGFPNKGYVVSGPTNGLSRTQGDFYQSGVLKYNDAKLLVTTFDLTGN